MAQDNTLKENVSHGTPENPIDGICFTHGPGTPWPDYFFVDRHWHRETEILYFLRGDFKIEIDLETHLAHTGDFCFIGSESLHKITGLTKNSIHHALLFDPSILAFSYPDSLQEDCIALFLRKERAFPLFLRPSDKEYENFAPRLKELLKISILREDHWYLSSKLALLDLICRMNDRGMLPAAPVHISAADRIKIDRYKQISSYIDAHYADPLTLQELADLISCNSQYLCRFFREITGTTPIQYLISRRIEHACEELTETTRPILEISLNCGFDNISYFIRKFRQLKGCTPKEYRKKQC